MKTIKSAVIGVKKIESSDPEEQLAQLREILTAHSHVLVDRLLRDLPSYLIYKFEVRLSKDQLEETRTQLTELKKKEIDLEKFRPVVNEMNTRALVYLSNDIFYAEIDDVILSSIDKKKVSESADVAVPFLLE